MTGHPAPVSIVRHRENSAAPMSVATGSAGKNRSVERVSQGRTGRVEPNNSGQAQRIDRSPGVPRSCVPPKCRQDDYAAISLGLRNAHFSTSVNYGCRLGPEAGQLFRHFTGQFAVSGHPALGTIEAVAGLAD